MTASPQSKNRSPSGPTRMLPPCRSSCWIEAGIPAASSSATAASTAARLPRSRRRAASAAARSSSRDPGPGHVVLEEAGQLPGEPARPPVGDARGQHLVACRLALDRALERRVLGEDPLPRGDVVIARAVGTGRPQRRPAVLEQQPRPLGMDGQRQQDVLDPMAAEDLEQRTFVAAPGPDALNQTVVPSVGTRIAVDHGRTCGCSIGPLTRRPSPSSVAAIQASAPARHSGSSQVLAPVGISGSCRRRRASRTRRARCPARAAT